MFAHQVIEDLKKGSLRDKEGFLDRAFNLIPQCQHFHIGEYLSIRNLCKIEGKPIFDDFLYMKSPYKYLWIDCFNLPSKDYDYENMPEWKGFCDKFGVLVETRKDLNQLIIYGFHHFKKFNHWDMTPIIQTVNEVGTEKMRANVTPLPLNIEGIIFPEEADLTEDLCNAMIESLAIVDCTLRLLNCKNIKAEKILAPDKLNKKRRRLGKQELFNYHVLNVVVPSSKREYEETSIPLSHNRVHLCRGHFKEYTAEHPLFGKFTGLYWWQPHVRGQNKDGIVLKDYNVTHVT